MKKLSIESKSKAYDEALERARIYSSTTNSVADAELIELIFPELKESEDERIRKELLEHCKNQAKPYIQTGNKCPQIQSWIAWLEKQRDKDKLIQELGEYKVKYTQEVLSQHIEKQGEQNLDNSAKNCKDGQKPKEKTKIYDSMDNLIADALIEEIEGSELDDRGKYNRIHWIESHRQKHTWSEEDERERKRVVGLLEGWLSTFKETCYAEDCKCGIVWLKSLKPKPKQEWSVEDKSKIQRICKYLNEAKKYYADITEVRECIDWLKSLRHQNSWKPSDEQIIALRWVLNNVPYCKHKEEISGLLDQIKDL